MIKYSCPKCRTPLSSPRAMAGQLDECPVCRSKNVVPGVSGSGGPGRNRPRVLLLGASVATLLLGMLLVGAGVMYYLGISWPKAMGDGYRPCDKSLVFGMDGVTAMFREGEFDSGGFTRLYVNDTEVPVETMTIGEGGIISTIDFGKIKVKPAGNSRSAKIQVFLTSEQETKVQEFLSNAGRQKAAAYEAAEVKLLAKTRALAEKGDAKAQQELGDRYRIGNRVPEDDAEAVRWWRRSADQGNLGAQKSLGLAYADGTGVAKDVKAAYGWLLISNVFGSNDFLLRSMEERELTPAQVAEAREWAKAWKPLRAKSSAGFESPVPKTGEPRPE